LIIVHGRKLITHTVRLLIHHAAHTSVVSIVHRVSKRHSVGIISFNSGAVVVGILLLVNYSINFVVFTRSKSVVCTNSVLKAISRLVIDKVGRAVNTVHIVRAIVFEMVVSSDVVNVENVHRVLNQHLVIVVVDQAC